MMNHSARGQALNAISVTDGTIQMLYNGSEVEIGPLSDLTDVYGETYECDSGLEIDVERLVDNMAITDNQADNIVHSTTERASSTSLFSERMNHFRGLVDNQLKGDIRRDDQ
jgi:hypothetical protein